MKKGGFKRYTFTCFRSIIINCFAKLFKRVFTSFCNRHEFFAKFFISSCKRNCKANIRTIICKVVNAFYNSTG